MIRLPPFLRHTPPSPLPRDPLPPLRPLVDEPMRDPSICLGPDDHYYLTGTTGSPDWWTINEGVHTWRSPDLQQWEPLGLVWSIELNGTWQREVHSWRGQALRAVWAPEIHYLRDTFWIAYCMNWRRCGLLRSTSGQAIGPYEDTTGPLVKGIDASLFEDADGSIHLLYQNGTCAKLNHDLSGLAERPRILKPAGERAIGFEGSSLTRIDGRYHLLGARFHRTDNGTNTYDCMAASATNLRGPYGPAYLAIPHGGHNMVFLDRQQQAWSTFFGNDRDAPCREQAAILPIAIGMDHKIRPVQTVGPEAQPTLSPHG